MEALPEGRFPFSVKLSPQLWESACAIVWEVGEWLKKMPRSAPRKKAPVNRKISQGQQTFLSDFIKTPKDSFFILYEDTGKKCKK